MWARLAGTSAKAIAMVSRVLRANAASELSSVVEIYNISVQEEEEAEGSRFWRVGDISLSRWSWSTLLSLVIT